MSPINDGISLDPESMRCMLACTCKNGGFGFENDANIMIHRCLVEYYVCWYVIAPQVRITVNTYAKREKSAVWNIVVMREMLLLLLLFKGRW